MTSRRRRTDDRSLEQHLKTRRCSPRMLGSRSNLAIPTSNELLCKWQGPLPARCEEFSYPILLLARKDGLCSSVGKCTATANGINSLCVMLKAAVNASAKQLKNHQQLLIALYIKCRIRIDVEELSRRCSFQRRHFAFVGTDEICVGGSWMSV